MKALPLLTREEIKRGFITAGWEVPGPPRYPIVGNPNDISITAHEQCADTEDSAFELIDRRLSLIYWVRVIPTPRQAVVLLWERGGPPEWNKATPTRRVNRTKAVREDLDSG